MLAYDSAFLSFKTYNIEEIIKTPSLLEIARSLTICMHSGMNCALNAYSVAVDLKTVEAKAIFAYYIDYPVGWLLYTAESDSCEFLSTPGQVCVQLFVRSEFRRKGIGTKLMDVAAKLADKNIVKVYAWDNVEFFNSVIINSNQVQSL